jgi:hypothetical protein
MSHQKPTHQAALTRTLSKWVQKTVSSWLINLIGFVRAGLFYGFERLTSSKSQKFFMCSFCVAKGM